MLGTLTSPLACDLSSFHILKHVRAMIPFHELQVLWNMCETKDKRYSVRPVLATLTHAVECVYSIRHCKKSCFYTVPSTQASPFSFNI